MIDMDGVSEMILFQFVRDRERNTAIFSRSFYSLYQIESKKIESKKTERKKDKRPDR